MKAARFHEYGGRDLMVYEDVPDPVLGSGEVLIRVRATGVNHVDIDLRNGSSRFPLKLPHILGLEVAGEVVDLAPDVVGLSVNSRVTPLYQINCRSCRFCVEGEHSLCRNTKLLGLHLPGGYAEYVKVPAWCVLPLPDRVSYGEAAAFQTTFGTAWHSLISRALLRAGETVLVSAAGSGVGSAAIQIAGLAGAIVIASAGDDRKLDRARELGASFGVNYRTQDLTQEVLAFTGSEGVDVVFEHVGGEVFSKSLKTLRPNGRLVVVGGHGGEIVPLDLITLFRNQWTVIGCQRQTEGELRAVFELIRQGILKTVIHAVVPLEEAAEAHRILEEREHFGKVILRP